MNDILDMIRDRWAACVRENRQDDGNLIGLPCPYTVPCTKGAFQEMYYWDTYFTNLGLLRQGLSGLAEGNTENLLSLVERYGYVPNGSRTFYLNRSQPPYLAMMVRDCFERNPDLVRLRKAYATLKKEYDFWMTRRITPLGLNRYYHHGDEALVRKMVVEVRDRVKVRPGTNEEIFWAGEHILAECESGWDFNPRFDGRCADFIPVDLNANLYLYETCLARFAGILETGEGNIWEDRALTRKRLIDRYCWNEQKGLYLDYDMQLETSGTVESLATFSPLWAGLADADQARAVFENLKLFEHDFGLVSCRPGPRKQVYQWDYPNGWPNLQWLAAKGLSDYGYREAAVRIGKKYLTTVLGQYRATGDLWEKYNVTDGTINVANEYEMPKMMGWTAGVFVALAELTDDR